MRYHQWFENNNSSTRVGPMKSLGDDNNIDLNLKAKGSGKLNFIIMLI